MIAARHDPLRANGANRPAPLEQSGRGEAGMQRIDEVETRLAPANGAVRGNEEGVGLGTSMASYASGGMTEASASHTRAARRRRAFHHEIAILKSCRDRHIVQFIGACLQVPCPHLTQHFSSRPP